MTPASRFLGSLLLGVMLCASMLTTCHKKKGRKKKRRTRRKHRTHQRPISPPELYDPPRPDVVQNPAPIQAPNQPAGNNPDEYELVDGGANQNPQQQPQGPVVVPNPAPIQAPNQPTDGNPDEYELVDGGANKAPPGMF